MNVAVFFYGTASATAISGGDRYCLELCRSWQDARGLAVEVYASHAGKSAIERFGYRLPVRSSESRPSTVTRFRLAYVGRFFRAVLHVPRMRDARVVFSTSAYFYDLLPAALLVLRVRARGKPCTLVAPIFHLIPPPTKRPGNPIVNTLAWIEQRTMVRVAKRLCDRIVISDPVLGAALAGPGGARARKIFRTAMGVRHVNGAARPDAGTPYALYVGRISAAKGVVDLLDCWQILQARGVELDLRLVGSLDGSIEIDRAIAERGLRRVSVRLGASDREVDELIRGARVCVTASREEGYGLSVLESLAAHVPCVTYDLPIFRDAFPAGRAVAGAFDARHLADAVERVASQPAERERLRQAIETFYRFATWDAVAGALWDEIMTANTPRVPAR